MAASSWLEGRGNYLRGILAPAFRLGYPVDAAVSCCHSVPITIGWNPITTPKPIRRLLVEVVKSAVRSRDEPVFLQARLLG